MTTRTPLDLRGLTMTELMEMNQTISNKLDGSYYLDYPDEYDGKASVLPLLADRRQIRERMEELREETAIRITSDLTRHSLPHPGW